MQTQKPDQFCSNHSENQSALTRNTTLRQHSLVSLKNSTNFVKFIHRQPNMNRKQDLRQYKGGFILDKVKSLNPRGRKEEKVRNWQGKSDREESLSNYWWHERPPTKKKTAANTSETTQINVKDAREIRSSRSPPVKIFQPITEESTQPAKQRIPKMKTTQAVQTDNFKVLVGTQTDISEERPETQEVFMSRINYDIASQEEGAPNEEPPTMTRTQPEATQLESSHH